MLRLALLAALAFVPSAADAADPPNVVLIIADDLGDGDLGCRGHPHIRTPNIDRLATQGVRFTNAVLTISSCSPSRSSLLTGKYPHETDAEQLHWPLPASNETFSERLKAKGYFTAAVGKWHLGNAVKDRFDLVVEAGQGGFVLPTGPDGQPMKMTAGANPSGCEDWVPVLKNRPQDKPFFLWLAALDPHRAYEDDTIPNPHTAADAVVPPFLPDVYGTRSDLAAYMDEVTRLDGYVGEVLAELDRQGVAENTLVIFMSDNGRPFPRCKTTLYDSGVKTPLIARLPGVTPAGTTSERLVSSVDVSATILDLCDAGPLKKGRGESFLPLLNDPAGPAIREYAFSEKNWHDYDASQRSVRTTDYKYIHNLAPELPNTPPADAVRSPTFVAMRHLRESLTPEQAAIFTPGPAEELYDLSADPHELNNLAADPAHAAALNELRGALAQWRTDTADPSPPLRSPDEFDREEGTPLPARQRPRSNKATMFPN
ncbi:sulfatase family protein [Alienimonas chondri]|uniref:Multifunctional alkaline phosphatase superfamily protein PehA n=1 Tax=Alienimonas chondri TaxID=2681879 RepID=A0ABX1VN55_9PLAN|nr:sulfatase [Alienimonas chondri]NNJ28073.1 Multifunctional alkaline phosphatase superfamily protein PehA [Alienimonas chondri]